MEGVLGCSQPVRLQLFGEVHRPIRLPCTWTSAMPPLVDCEREPGETLRLLLEMPHPFALPPPVVAFVTSSDAMMYSMLGFVVVALLTQYFAIIAVRVCMN